MAAPLGNADRRILNTAIMTHTQILASHFNWMHILLTQLGKDGKDILWRVLGESLTPEYLIESENYGQKCVPD